MERSAIVVGAGIGGLSAALALRGAGYGVRVLERAPALEPLGAALSIWGNAMAALDHWGCGHALRAVAAPVRGVTLSTTGGRVLFGPVDLSATDSWLPTRAALQAVLLEALGTDRVELGMAVDDVREADGRAHILVKGETVGESDLAVVADGIWSRVGARFGDPPAYAGYGGAIGIGEAGAMLADGMGEEIWGERERFGLFNVGAGRPYWFYMGSMDADAVALLTRADLIGRAQAFPRRVRQALENTPAHAITNVAIHAKPPPRAMGRGRVVGIGDAVHAMEPNQGQGACQAIEDAWALGILAARLPPDAIVGELERQRLARAGRYVRDSALVGRAAHSPRGWERAAVQGALALVPRALDRLQVLSRLKPVRYA